MTENYQNIPTNSIVVTSAEHKTARVNVAQLQKANISLSTFACIQFLAGAKLWLDEITGETVSIKRVQLLNKLWGHLRNENINDAMEVSRQELSFLLHWLETRMRHCEKQRDERSKSFSPDTYIGQKLLLLDVRELLLGEILPEAE